MNQKSPFIPHPSAFILALRAARSTLTLGIVSFGAPGMNRTMNDNFEAANLGAPDLGFAVQRETSMTIGRMTVPLFVILVFAIVQSIRFGLRTSDYFILIVGSVLTTLFAFAYGLVTVIRANGSPKKAWMMFAAFGGMFPYLFFLYLFFYRGLWALSALLNGFSFRPILKAIIFCVLAYAALKQFYRITEVGRMVDASVRNEA